MLKPDAVLFVDASNVYLSLKRQGDLPFGSEGYAKLLKELSETFEVKRVLFYDSVKNRALDLVGYSKQQRFHEKLRKTLPLLSIKTRKLIYPVKLDESFLREAAETTGLAGVSSEKLYSFLKQLGFVKLSKEKGLDVLIVVDMLQTHKTERNDYLILFSGDSDFVPAVELIQSEGAKVVNLHLWNGSSTELRRACFAHALFDASLNKLVYSRKIDSLKS